MLISPQFVFLHTPKTGGGTVTRILQRALPPGTLTTVPAPRPHPGREDIPAHAAALPVLAFVRNPWDWYVSWYHFGRTRPKQNRLWQSAFGDGQDFATTVRAACTGGLHHDKPTIAAALREGMDFYTARLLHITGSDLDDPQLTVGRFEHLLDDLEAFLRAHQAPIPDDFAALAESEPIVHLGDRGSYADYYDDELRDLVGSSCQALCERFGYAFEAAAGHSAR